jgi:hypothetical protein
MKTITVLAWRRPEYTKRCLEALERCRMFGAYKTFISIDGERTAETDATYSVAENFADKYPKLVDVIQCRVNRGVADHPEAAYEYAFTGLGYGSDFNVAIEDDCLLAPDALELADWFYAHPNRDQWAFLNLGHIQGDGWDRPMEVCESSQIVSPWCWAFTRETWAKIRPCWNQKQQVPVGWDWSLSYTMALNGWTSLYPYLSRAYNIGKEGGVHTVPSAYDAELGFMSWSGDGTQPVPPAITSPVVTPLDASKPVFQEWMIPEMQARGIVR